MHEWIQVSFADEVLITAVETQGRFDDGRGAEYSGAYMIEYWRNSLGIWQRFKDSTGNEVSKKCLNLITSFLDHSGQFRHKNSNLEHAGNAVRCKFGATHSCFGK